MSLSGPNSNRAAVACGEGHPADGCGDPIVSRLCALHHTLMRVADRVLAPVGLTASRLMLLRRVEGAEEGPMLSRLSEQLSLSVQAVSRMVAALEDEGFVTRTTRPGAGRCVFVELTEHGRASLERAASVLEAVSAELRTGMDESEERRIEAALDRMLESLRAREDEPESAEVRG